MNGFKVSEDHGATGSFTGLVKLTLFLMFSYQRFFFTSKDRIYWFEGFLGGGEPWLCYFVQNFF